MRITGGQVRGRILASPQGLKIRPTTDRVREAIFNIIGQDLSGLKVLDLFAGTGCLGLEALSRGALSALFIDNSQQAIKLIKKNLALCGYQTSGTVLRRDLRTVCTGTSTLQNKLVPWIRDFGGDGVINALLLGSLQDLTKAGPAAYKLIVVGKRNPLIRVLLQKVLLFEQLHGLHHLRECMMPH